MARTQYTEELVLSMQLNKSDVEKIQKQFDDLKIDKLLSPEATKQLKEEYEKRKKEELAIKKINEEIADLKGLDTKEAKAAVRELNKQKRTLEKESVSSILKQGVQKGLVEAGEKAWDGIKKLAESVWTEAKQMLQQMAAFSENSSIYSQEATDLAMNYGLTGAQAYAAQMASKDTGFGSFGSYIENAAFATQETKDRWNTLFEKYEMSYKQDKEIAEEFQHFQTEWQDFKKEMGMEIIHFFMENKDTIKDFLHLGLDFMSFVTKTLGGIAKTLTGNAGVRSADERQAAISDILAGNVSNYSTRTVSVTNTFNGVQSADRVDLINAGLLTYQQVLKAL